MRSCNTFNRKWKHYGPRIICRHGTQIAIGCGLPTSVAGRSSSCKQAPCGLQCHSFTSASHRWRYLIQAMGTIAKRAFLHIWMLAVWLHPCMHATLVLVCFVSLFVFKVSIKADRQIKSSHWNFKLVFFIERTKFRSWSYACSRHALYIHIHLYFTVSLSSHLTTIFGCVQFFVGVAKILRSFYCWHCF